MVTGAAGESGSHVLRHAVRACRKDTAAVITLVNATSAVTVWAATRTGSHVGPEIVKVNTHIHTGVGGRGHKTGFPLLW